MNEKQTRFSGDLYIGRLRDGNNKERCEETHCFILCIGDSMFEQSCQLTSKNHSVKCQWPEVVFKRLLSNRPAWTTPILTSASSNAQHFARMRNLLAESSCVSTATNSVAWLSDLARLFSTCIRVTRLEDWNSKSYNRSKDWNIKVASTSPTLTRYFWLAEDIPPLRKMGVASCLGAMVTTGKQLCAVVRNILTSEEIRVWGKTNFSLVLITSEAVKLKKKASL